MYKGVIFLVKDNNPATKHKIDGKLLVWPLRNVSSTSQTIWEIIHSHHIVLHIFSSKILLLRSTENITAYGLKRHEGEEILREFSWNIPLKPHSSVLSSDSPCVCLTSLSSDPDQYPSCRALAPLVVTSCSVCTHTWPDTQSFIWSPSSSLSQRANIPTRNETVVTEKNTSAYPAGYMTLDQRKRPW